MFTKPKTVDAAIAPLLKAQADLEGVNTSLETAIVKNEDTINRLEDENEAHETERLRAVAVLKALGAITDPKEGT